MGSRRGEQKKYPELGLARDRMKKLRIPGLGGSSNRVGRAWSERHIGDPRSCRVGGHSEGRGMGQLLVCRVLVME